MLNHGTEGSRRSFSFVLCGGARSAYPLAFSWTLDQFPKNNPAIWRCRLAFHAASTRNPSPLPHSRSPNVSPHSKNLPWLGRAVPADQPPAPHCPRIMPCVRPRCGTRNVVTLNLPKQNMLEYATNPRRGSLLDPVCLVLISHSVVTETSGCTAPTATM